MDYLYMYKDAYLFLSNCLSAAATFLLVISLAPLEAGIKGGFISVS